MSEPGELTASGLLLRLALRSPLRLAGVLLTMTVAAVLLFGTMFFRHSVGLALERGVERLGADLMVVPADSRVEVEHGLIGGVPTSLSLPPGLLARARRVTGVEAVAPQHFLASAVADCCETGNLFLVGFERQEDFTILPWARLGDAGPESDEPLWVGGAVTNQRGARMRFYNHTFTVAGRLDRTGLGYFDNAVFIPMDGVRRMEETAKTSNAVPLQVAWQHPSILLVRLASGSDAAAARAELAALSPEAEVLAPTALADQTRERLEAALDILLPMSFLGWLLALLTVTSAQLLYWSMRRPALGLLQALGASAGRVRRLFIGEAASLGLLAALLGAALVYLVLLLFRTYFQAVLGFPFLPGPTLFGHWEVFATLAGFLLTAALPPALVLGAYLRREPYALVRGGR